MLWLKAFHIIAVVCWFAGLFYLPRLFVYHADTHDEPGHERFVIMARKLYRGIMWPSMTATRASGAALLMMQWPARQGQGGRQGGVAEIGPVDADQAGHEVLPCVGASLGRSGAGRKE